MPQLARMDFRSTSLSPAARALGLLIVIAVAVSMALQFVANSLQMPDLTGLQIAWRMARYFTILTNGLVLATFLWVCIGRFSPGATWMGGVTLWIDMTGAIFYLLLTHEQPPLSEWADFGLHAVTPVMVSIWWLAFAPKASLRSSSALAWLLWPAIYIVYALLRGRADGNYPYFFIDPSQVGWDGVAIWSALIGLGFLVCGLVLVFIGRRFKR